MASSRPLEPTPSLHTLQRKQGNLGMSTASLVGSRHVRAIRRLRPCRRDRGPSPAQPSDSAHPRHTSIFTNRWDVIMTPSSVLTRILCVLTIGVFATIFPHVASSDKLEKQPGFLYLASFNVYKLGGVELRYKRLKGIENPKLLRPDHIPNRIRNLARVLAVGDFDLVALQEVHEGAPGRAALSDLVRVFNDEHAISYRFILSDGIGDGLIPEAIAFLYKPDRVQPENVNDTGSQSIIVDIDGRYSNDPKPPRGLVQTQWEAGHFDFTLISAHLAWANHDKRRAGYEKVREIFESPSDWSHDPDVIVLGDFNRLGDHATAVEALPYDSETFRVPNITFFDPEFSKQRQVTKRSIQGKGVPGDDPQLLSTTVAGNKYAYDMIMFSRDAGEEFPAELHEARYGVDFGIIHLDHPTGFGFQPGADELKHNALKRAYSDHRPVWMRFRTDNAAFSDD